MKRLVQPELLDTLPAGDPRAVGSRRDLRRINWWMGNHAIMAKALLNCSQPLPKQITELGAGDGDFLLQVVKKFQTGQIFSQFDPLPVTATLLDLKKNVSVKTRRAFAELGWRAKVVVADVFDWAPVDGTSQVVVTNLFLHHFKDAKLAELLGNISETTKLFIAVEPHRFTLPLLVGKLLWLIGCNEVTRHDAVISIRAGFTGREISTLWPDKENWQLTERRSGLFSHIFMARRHE